MAGISDFCPRFQKYACLLSVLTAILISSLGIGFVVSPRFLVRVLLDFEMDRQYAEAIDSVGRMAGGALLALGTSCIVLWLGLLREWTRGNNVSQTSVTTGRVAVAIQSIMGLFWVIFGLIDDRMNESSSFRRRETFGLLVVGFSILIISCWSLMLSFWPVEALSTTGRSLEAISQQDPDAMPLLMRDGAANNNNPEDENVPDQDEEVARYRLLADDNPRMTTLNRERPQGESDYDDDDASHNSQPTSRIRGTRRLLKLAAPQVMYLYIGCITLLVRLPFSLSIPHFVSTTLAALAQNQYDRARREVFWLFLLGTIDACLDFWCIFWFGYANLRIVRGVRIDTFASILRQEIGFFDKQTSGELSSRLNSDCGEMAGDLTWFFRFSIESVVRISGITTYMLIRSPRLGACALSIIPVVAIVNKYYGTWLGKNARKVQDALAAANSVAQETFACIRTVIAFASENLEYDKYVEKVDVQYQLNVRQTYMTGIYYMFVSTFLINTVVQGTLLLIGSYMIERGNLTGEILLAFMLYQGQLQSEMMNLFQSYSSIIKSSGAGDKVFALLDRNPPSPATGSRVVQSYEGQLPDRDASLSVTLDKLVFSYPSRPDYPVLKGLDLIVGEGQTVALVGPSGCGKSTIIGLIQRFYDPTTGRVLINGVDVKNLDIKAHRRRLGVVTQDPILFSGTILSNITYGMHGATLEQAIEAAKQANAHEFISRFPDGYSTEVGERGVQLSGGQKQRIAIARAIIRNPSLLLLDEATSALDADSEEIVQAALDNLLNKSKGTTTIVIAHRLRTVRNADVIAVVNEGRIVELGSHVDLMKLTKGYYRGMVEKSLGDKLPNS